MGHALRNTTHFKDFLKCDPINPLKVGTPVF